MDGNMARIVKVIAASRNTTQDAPSICDLGSFYLYQTQCIVSLVLCYIYLFTDDRLV